MQKLNIIDKKQRRKLVRSDLRFCLWNRKLLVQWWYTNKEIYLCSCMFLERRYDKDDRFKSRIFIFK